MASKVLKPIRKHAFEFLTHRYSNPANITNVAASGRLWFTLANMDIDKLIAELREIFENESVDLNTRHVDVVPIFAYETDIPHAHNEVTYVLEYVLENMPIPQIVDLLLEYGADPNINDYGLLTNFSLLWDNSGRYYGEIRHMLMSLIDHGLVINDVDPDAIKNIDTLMIFISLGYDAAEELLDYIPTRKRWEFITHEQFIRVLDVFQKHGVDVVSRLGVSDLIDIDTRDYSIIYFEDSGRETGFYRRKVEIYPLIYYKILYGLSIDLATNEQLEQCLFYAVLHDNKELADRLYPCAGYRDALEYIRTNHLILQEFIEGDLHDEDTLDSLLAECHERIANGVKLADDDDNYDGYDDNDDDGNDDGLRLRKFTDFYFDYMTFLDKWEMCIRNRKLLTAEYMYAVDTFFEKRLPREINRMIMVYLA